MLDHGERGGGGMNAKGVDGSQQLVKCFDHPWGMFSKLKWVSVVQQCVVTWTPIFAKIIRTVTAQYQADFAMRDGYCCGNSSFVFAVAEKLGCKKQSRETTDRQILARLRRLHHSPKTQVGSSPSMQIAYLNLPFFLLSYSNRYFTNTEHPHTQSL